MMTIWVKWDDEAGVWIATSDDIPGLATEAETMDALSAKLTEMVPELLQINGGPAPNTEVQFKTAADFFRSGRQIARLADREHEA